MAELKQRLKQKMVSYRVYVQLAEAGNALNDATVVWPNSRKKVELGTLNIKAMHPRGAKFEKATMFSPLNITDGIEPSEAPILLLRPGAYAVSFGRRLQP